MSKKPRTKKHGSALIRRATRRDLRALARKTEAGFEQLVMMSAVALKLTQKEIRDLRRRVARLERKIASRR